MTYVQGFVTAVPEANKAAYEASARNSWDLLRDYGAVAQWECWEDDVPEGVLTSFPKAVQRAEGEKVVFAWVVWRDKAACEACHASYDTDPRWQELDMPFDGKRMIYGGFSPIFTATA